MKNYYVYVLTNRPFGSLYIGVTNDLARRVFDHRSGLGGAFTKKYRLKRLVYYEWFDDALAAIQREKTLKRWLCRWKLTAINNFNPNWDDLYEALNQ